MVLAFEDAMTILNEISWWFKLTAISVKLTIIYGEMAL